MFGSSLFDNEVLGPEHISGRCRSKLSGEREGAFGKWSLR
jgi:hypothetical protein